MITSQVIQHIVEAPLVIADLTGRNPNVFYELSLRHALKKPVVQIIQSKEEIPFDVAVSRTIHVDHHDLDSAAKAREEIVKQIRAVEKNAAEVDTPISVAIELQSLRQSDNPLEKSNAEILAMLQDIRGAVGEVRTIAATNAASSPERQRLSPGLVQELVMAFDRQASILADDGKALDGERLDVLRRLAVDTSHLLEVLLEEAGERVVPPGYFRRRFRTRDPQNKPS
jgi:hypothetical protein